MGKKSVGRPAKNTLRVELRLNADHPMTQELEREAAAHHVSLQQYITDILLARYMRRQETQQQEEQDQSVETSQDSASKLADEWM